MGGQRESQRVSLVAPGNTNHNDIARSTNPLPQHPPPTTLQFLA